MSGEAGAIGSDQIIFATGGYDHTIKLWQTHTGNCQKTLQHAESQVNMLEITPDRRYLAAASYQHIRMFDLTTTNQNHDFNYEGVPKNVTAVGFEKNTKWMYSGGEDGKVRIWDLRETTNNPHHYEVFAPVTCVQLHPNQSEVFIGDQNGTIHMWDMKTDNADQYIPDLDNMIIDLAINPDGTHLAAVNSKGRCFIWSISGGCKSEERTTILPKNKFEAHPRQALKCKFSPDSNYLVTTSSDQTAKIWDAKNNFKLIKELKHNNKRWVWDAAFSSDSQYLFTGSSDNIARLWNVKDGTIEREYVGHQKAITTIAFRDVFVPA
ncbi:PREDICTED: target of rapamycin complex subunit lst8 [Nicrophorus vespilloides]|uniref:Target of rapamycin complex subunit lst8 n=1 Tax=Nicrophorus vespilloides TaxID=110193 RepID=A0ABM1M168_NICVS|nr:PREDICTED: target of rapamycin complex subunit lst8 [Nicrophorus vespilloides]